MSSDRENLVRLRERVETIADMLRLGSGSKNDPFHVGMDAARDLYAALDDTRDTPPSIFGNDFECCASGRCEVCHPGWKWGA